VNHLSSACRERSAAVAVLLSALDDRRRLLAARGTGPVQRADGLTQAGLARQLGMRQPHIARLESGDHEPSLSMLARLSAGLGLDFSVEVKPDRMRLRYAVRDGGDGNGERKRV
jgi:DNA-binding phage protein